MEEYKERVVAVMDKWRVEKEREGEDAEGKKKNAGNKLDEEKNDFRVDKERLRACYYLEEHSERLCFDPDQDGFNFGYDMALTFKVRFNMFRLIRKEILSQNYKFWEEQVDDLALKFNKPEFKEQS